MQAFRFALLALLSTTACSQSFDIAPATQVSPRQHGAYDTDASSKSAPSSPQLGYAFSFSAKLPAGWSVASRGSMGSIEPGYHPLCVVSKAGTNDKMLFLLSSNADETKRIEDAAHMNDGDWWQPRIPRTFLSGHVQDEEVGLRIANGNFAGADDVEMFTVLLCDPSNCDESLAQSDGFAGNMKLRVVHADDPRVVSPGAEDCGSFF